jgi:hypothetical protein
VKQRWKLQRFVFEFPHELPAKNFAEDLIELSPHVHEANGVWRVSVPVWNYREEKRVLRIANRWGARQVSKPLTAIGETLASEDAHESTFNPYAMGVGGFVGDVIERVKDLVGIGGDDEQEAAFLCLGRSVIFELDDEDIELPKRWGMLHDETGTLWNRDSLLFVPFKQGQSPDDSQEGLDYFGHQAYVRTGSVKIPNANSPHWHEVGAVRQIYYVRAGTKHPGKYRHEFNTPRELLLKLIGATFKRHVRDTPPVLFALKKNSQIVAYRLELPDGSMIDDRGLVLP